MSLILNIDTTLENAQVSFAENGIVVSALTNNTQKDHASFLQHAIQQLIKTTGIELKNIDAIAVAAGPGSYTGLRVGMASAKGLCYALKKPLIALNTLEILTMSALEELEEKDNELLFCPMIDARRMEVFTAIYQKDLTVVLPPCAMILHEKSLEQFISKSKILFFGNGSQKWKTICNHTNALFQEISNSPGCMAKLAHQYFSTGRFVDLAYSDPIYIKDFQSVITK
jgi:universal bacterial protein YeaZ